MSIARRKCLKAPPVLVRQLTIGEDLPTRRRLRRVALPTVDMATNLLQRAPEIDLNTVLFEAGLAFLAAAAVVPTSVLGMDKAGTGSSVVLLPALSSISTRTEMHPSSSQFQVTSLGWPGFGDLPRLRENRSPCQSGRSGGWMDRLRAELHKGREE
jgi:hypothetical protein